MRDPAANRVRRLDPLTRTTLLAGVVTLLLLGVSSWLNQWASREAAELIPLGHSVGLKVYAAHLWVEEALGGDSGIDLSRQVFGNLDGAIRLIDTALRGTGGAQRIGDLALRRHLEDLKRRIVDLRGQTERRLAAPLRGGIGSAMDSDFDRSFAQIVELNDRVSIELESRVQRRWH